MQAEVIQEPLTGGIVGHLQLIQQPWNVIPAAVSRAVSAAGNGCVVGTVEVIRPAPFFRRHYLCGRVNGFDFAAVIQKQIADAVHRRAVGHDRAVIGRPDAVFIVHHVILHTIAGGIAELVRQILNPLLLNGGAVGNISVIRIVRSNRPSGMGHGVRADAISSVRPIRIVAGLRAILGDGVRSKSGAARAEFRNPVQHGNGDHRLSATRFGRGDKGIGRSAGRRTVAFAEAFEKPVAGAIRGIDLPVVSGSGVATTAIDAQVQIAEAGLVRPIRTVNERTDGVTISIGVDIDGRGGIVGQSSRGNGCHDATQNDKLHETVVNRIDRIIPGVTRHPRP